MEGERVFEVIFRVMRKCLDYGLWVMLLMPGFLTLGVVGTVHAWECGEG